MQRRDVAEAKAQFSQLLALVEKGEEVIIMRDGKLVAKLVAYHGATLPRKFGGMAGKIVISDDFDDFSPEIEKMFYESSIEPQDIEDDSD